jgi:hypothetical protein
VIAKWVYDGLDKLAREGSWVRKWFFRFYAPILGTVFHLTLVFYPVFCIMSWLRLGLRKVLRLKPAVLWGPAPIINIVESSRLMKKLGYRSKSMVFTVYFITNKFDVNLQRLTYNPLVSPLFPNILFLWTLLRYDVYHFFYDGGLWSGMKIVPRARWLEFPLLRLAGKRIVATAYGADVRTRLRDEMWQPWNLCIECPEPGVHCLCDDQKGIVNTKYYRDWCNKLIAMGDMHDYVYGGRPNFVHWPIDLNEVKFVGAHEHDGPLIVAHSPNHRHFKGTRFVEAAVNALREKGHNVILDIIERVPNEEAKLRYAAADIIFAQCILGWPGFTEIESMAAGKPVLTYVRDEDRYLRHLPGWTAISVTPDTAEAVLEELLTNPLKRAELGQKGRTHVEEHWSYEACGPHYDALHKKLWRDNKLGATLKAKWNDVRFGEERPSVTQGLFAECAQLPVRTDGKAALARVAWGQYGRPLFDSHGILQVNRGVFGLGIHIGVVAKYVIDALQVCAEHPDVGQETLYLAQADWLRDAVEAGKFGQMEFVATHSGGLSQIPEAPQRVQASRTMAYAALVLAGARHEGRRYEQAAARCLDSILSENSPTHALRDDGSGGKIIHEGAGLPRVEHLPGLILTATVLANVAKAGSEQRLQGLAHSTAAACRGLVDQLSVDQIVATRKFSASDFFDEVYFVAYGLKCLGVFLEDAILVEKGEVMRKQIVSRRWRNFLKFIAPL